MGATVIRTSGSEGAIFVEVRACENGFFQVFLRRALQAPKGEEVVPHRARYQRRRGGGRTPRRRHVELPRLARPKGCFDTSAEWS